MKYSTLKIADNSTILSLQLKTCLMDEWAQFDQPIVDAAISQWCRRLSACVHVHGAHFENKFRQF